MERSVEVFAILWIQWQRESFSQKCDQEWSDSEKIIFQTFLDLLWTLVHCPGDMTYSMINSKIIL